jgi:hypothetical protein
MDSKQQGESDYWAMEDAAAYVGLTRQRLNTLITEGRYPGKVVPFRPPRTDSTGRHKNVRFRILTTAVVERIRKHQDRQEALRAEVKANAEKKRRAAAKAPRKPRGRPKKVAEAAAPAKPTPSVFSLPD